MLPTAPTFVTPPRPLEGKRILVTGGTGSLGRSVVRRLLTGEMGTPASVTVLSRDEAKQHYMRLEFMGLKAATDDIIYRQARQLLRFRLGDVRDFHTVAEAVRVADVVFQAAALKQVPSCEYFPWEAVRTNVEGSVNLMRALAETHHTVETVVAISTDKACKPINVMGMTKALMERVVVEANLRLPRTRCVAVRYGNVVASRGSVVPLFLEQIEKGGPVTITLPEMTRFLLTLDKAVDTVFAALRGAQPGEVYVPRAPSARIVDVADVLIGGRPIATTVTGIRPGEKLHELMVSEEERYRTVGRGDYYVIQPMLPELAAPAPATPEPPLAHEYSSEQVTLDADGLRALLRDFLERGLGAVQF